METGKEWEIQAVTTADLRVRSGGGEWLDSGVGGEPLDRRRAESLGLVWLASLRRCRLGYAVERTKGVTEVISDDLLVIAVEHLASQRDQSSDFGTARKRAIC